MARHFVAASSQKLDGGSAPVTAAPYTFSAWVKVGAYQTVGRVMTLWNSGSTNEQSAVYITSTGLVSFNFKGGVDTYATTTTPATGTWAHVCAIFTASNVHSIYLNGAYLISTSSTGFPSGLNRVTLGASGASSQYFDGDIADAAFWSVQLSHDEIVALSARVSPLKIRPASLAAYWVLTGSASPELDSIGSDNLTVTGATSATSQTLLSPAQHVAAVVMSGSIVTSSIRLAGMRISDELNSPRSCTFRMDGSAPSTGSDLKVLIGDSPSTRVLFAGTVLKSAQAYEGKPANVEWDVYAEDYTFLLNRRRPCVYYSSQSATTIAQSLVSSFSSGFSSASVENSLPAVSMGFDGSDDFMACLRTLATAAGAYCYVDSSRDVHLFTSEATDTPDTLDGTGHSLMLDPPIVTSTDLSPVRTRVTVVGAGSSVLAPRSAADDTIPIRDQSVFASGGGLAQVGSQRITYTGISPDAGNGSETRGVQQSPSTPSPSIDNTVGGRVNGAVGYAVSFISTDGESELSSTSGTVTGTQISTPGAPSLTASGAATFKIDYSLVYVDADGNETALGTTAQITSPITGGDPAVTVNATALNPWSSARVKQWRVYRRRVTLSPTNPSGSFYHVQTVSDGVTTSIVDHVPDSSVGAVMSHETSNNTGGQATITIPTGPGGTTARKLYRTAGGASQLQFLVTVSDNSTTSVVDKAADSSLGDVPPRDGGTIKTLAGSTSLTITDLSLASAGSGWVSVGSQIVRFTGRSASSGVGTLTGIPASGTGALISDVSAGTEVTFLPFLSGIPTSSTGSILYDINDGDAINIASQRNDTTAQTALAALEGGDGIHENVIKDTAILSTTDCQVRADADLALYKAAVVSISYATRDYKSRSGKTVTVSLSAPTSVSGTFKIQRVTIDQIDPASGRMAPRFTVEASNTKYSLEDLLRKLAAA